MHASELSLRKGGRTSNRTLPLRRTQSTPVDCKHFVKENPKKVLKLANPRAILYECARCAYFLMVFWYQILQMFHMKHLHLRIRPYIGVRQKEAEPAHLFTR